MNKWHVALQAIVGLSVLVVIITYFGINNYITVLGSVNIYWFLAACIPAFLIQTVTAYQVYYICNKTNVKFSFIDSFFISNWGGLIGLFNAGLDLLYTVEATKNYTNTDRRTILNRLGLMYSIGTLVTVFGVFLGFLYLGNKIRSVSFWLLSLAYIMLFCAIAFIMLLMGPLSIRRIKHYLFRKKILDKLFGKLLSDDLVNFRKQALGLLLLALLSWVFKALEWVFLSYALGFPLSWVFCFSVFFIVDLARQIPFVPTNFGLLDLVTAIGLSTAGMSAAYGLVFAMINRADNLVSNGFAFAAPQYLTSVFLGKSKAEEALGEGLLILNLGCGNQTYGTHRVDMTPTATTTHVFNIENGIQFPDNFFDVVYSRNLLEHLRNIGGHLEECYRVLKPGGTVEIITDNASCYRYYLFGTHTGRYEEKHREHQKDRHYSIFTKKHLQNHFEATGFKSIQTAYVKTDTLGRLIDIFTFGKPRIRVTAIK